MAKTRDNRDASKSAKAEAKGPEGRLWTPKFGLGLLILAVFLFDAFWKGPDPLTGAARHVLPWADTGIASFIFLLDLLYVLSHVWQWMVATVRRWRAPAEEPEEPRPSKEPREPKKGRKARRAR